MKKVLIMLAEGFEEVEALTVVDYLRRMDITCDTCSIMDGNKVKGAHNIVVEADKSLDEITNYDKYDGIVLPGGMPGATNLRDNDKVIEIVQSLYEEDKLIAAICAAPIILAKAGIIEGKNITSYPGFEEELKAANYKEDLVVQDGNIITARGPAVAVYFALDIVEYLLGKGKRESLEKDILLDLVK